MKQKIRLKDPMEQWFKDIEYASKFRETMDYIFKGGREPNSHRKNVAKLGRKVNESIDVYKYKTVEALLKANVKNIDWGLNLEQLTYGAFYSDKKGKRIKFELPEEECERVAKMVVEALNFRRANKKRVFYRIASCIMVHKEIPITTRLHIGVYSGKAFCNYCAGQDYIYETRAIRKKLAKF